MQSKSSSACQTYQSICTCFEWIVYTKIVLILFAFFHTLCPSINEDFCSRSRRTKILTTVIRVVFRGLKFESDADIDGKDSFRSGTSYDNRFSQEAFDMIRLISIFLYLIFYVCSPYFAFAVSPDEKDKKQVLVVHSYHLGYAWTDEVMNGVRDVLNKQSDLEVFIEYLDAKRYFGKAYFENMKQIYRDKYMNRGIDVIIISDDEAFDLVLEIRAECFPNVPIAVCGLNQDLKIISNINSAYAVEGGHDGIRSTIDLILSLQPDIETVFFVRDDSKTGKSKLQTFLHSNDLQHYMCPDT